MSFTIDTSEIDTLARKYQQAATIIPDEMVVSMKRVVTQIEADAKRIVPVQTRTLQRSITGTVTKSGGYVIGTVGSNVPYAKPVEEGRPAIIIRPVRGKYLRFEIDGQVIFAREVHQPARAGKPYLKPAVAKNAAAIQREFGPVLVERVSRRLGI